MAKENKSIIDNDLKNLKEMEHNLQKAIDDLITESEFEPKIVLEHVSMIITNLAMVAASIRMKTQQQTLNAH